MRSCVRDGIIRSFPPAPCPSHDAGGGAITMWSSPRLRGPGADWQVNFNMAGPAFASWPSSLAENPYKSLPAPPRARPAPTMRLDLSGPLSRKRLAFSSQAL
jgi:hypothetical protein